jgi:hypothetical protein
MTRHATTETHLATRRNGGIPPTVRRVDLIEIGALIGKGTEEDPLRLHYSYHLPDGTHLLSLSHPIDEPKS